MMHAVILILFALCLGFIFLYSLTQLSLVVTFLTSKVMGLKKSAPSWERDLPVVTVQLPIYNEFYVVERLLKSVVGIDYPKEKLEIQLLDDSTDNTSNIAAVIIEELKQQGFDVQHIQRTERTGYKAGALAYGTTKAKGEFIAIFDADFIPDKDFLKKSIPQFVKEKIGCVQSRWSFINEDYSLLTKMQAFGLNAHFSVEQVGRNAANHFINFNGTAGIWRKECINDAGGWEGDTLTEDLDLSYRAQVKGWKFVYLDCLKSPSELPVEMNALKAQQFRWNKGAAACVRKNLWRVWKGKNIGIDTKLHATFHLMNSTIFLAILLLSTLTIPVIILKSELQEYTYIFKLTRYLAVSWLILLLFYFVSYWNTKPKEESILNFFWKFPAFLAISMGLSFHNAIAVFEGYIGRKTPFVRTPKYNVEQEGSWARNIYNVKKISPITFFEGIMFCYSIFALFYAAKYNDQGIMPLIIFLVFGYGFVFLSSLFHWNKTKSAKLKEAVVK